MKRGNYNPMRPVSLGSHGDPSRVAARCSAKRPRPNGRGRSRLRAEKNDFRGTRPRKSYPTSFAPAGANSARLLFQPHVRLDESACRRRSKEAASLEQTLLSEAKPFARAAVDAGSAMVPRHIAKARCCRTGLFRMFSYLAYSTAFVSLNTWTLIWPG